MPERVRLHISPFNHDLLPILITPSILLSASNVSFHTVQTFPERNYGYIELPPTEAEKVKKKYNGMILKGSKVKVEEAKEKKDLQLEVEQDTKAKGKAFKKKKGKKRKREEGVLFGHELSEDRKIKRGWTEPPPTTKDKKSRPGDKDKAKPKKKPQLSTHTNEPECLFKTKVPANVKDLPKKGKQVKKGKGHNEVVVHEFEHSEKHPSFLRAGGGDVGKKQVVDYDDEMGWLDEEGNIVEPAKKAKKYERAKGIASTKKVDALGQTKHNMSSLSLEDRDDDETSSSGTSSASDPRSDDNSSPSEPSSDASNSSSAASEQVAEALDETLQSEKPLPHPLETLFKRPAPTNTPSKPALQVEAIPFSFFGDDNPAPTREFATPGTAASSTSKMASANKPLNLAIPQTPFTVQDRHWRGQRSAAPTPDTAAPNKSGFGDVWGGRNRYDDEDIEEEEEDKGQASAKSSEKEGSSSAASGDESEVTNNTPSASVKEKSEKGDTEEPKTESEFSKWFWENRGDNNRAWKKRKREAGKEKRQSENKRRDRNRS